MWLIFLRLPEEIRQHRSFPHRRTQPRQRASSQTVQHLDGAAARYAYDYVPEGLGPLCRLALYVR
jgi:hypothetical protein